MIVIFLVGYAFIALEHNIKVDKTATALITGVLCWTILAFGRDTILHNVELNEEIHNLKMFSKSVADFSIMYSFKIKFMYD